ncbi:MAG: SpoVG family protein, partial [Candidatus Krumholzibacteria bacterium]|nr:SpoVG family protein [Candidatus Krumholzibacteria bacterium]
MEITEIRISLRSDNKLKAFASITLDNRFVIRGLKIIEGAKGVFVAMPSR